MGDNNLLDQQFEDALFRLSNMTQHLTDDEKIQLMDGIKKLEGNLEIDDSIEDDSPFEVEDPDFVPLNTKNLPKVEKGKPTIRGCDICGNTLGEVCCTSEYGGMFCSTGCSSLYEADQELKTPHQDIINKPDHYHKGGIDIYEIMQAKYDVEVYRGFCIGNVEKYIKRHELKGKPLEDLKKARFNLDRLIETYEGKKYIPSYKLTQEVMKVEEE